MLKIYCNILIMENINANLLLRLLDIQEFFAHQWLMAYPNDHQKLSDLINIRKQQLSLKELIKDKDDDSGTGGGGGGTIKGLRAKDDPNIRNANASPFSKRMTRR